MPENKAQVQTVQMLSDFVTFQKKVQFAFSHLIILLCKECPYLLTKPGAAVFGQLG